MNELDLENRLGSKEEMGVTYSNDGTVRFVPFGYKIGDQSPSKARKNPYVIGLIGKEGAKKFAQLESLENKRYGADLFVHSFEEVDKKVIKISALCNAGFWGVFNWRGHEIENGNRIILHGDLSYNGEVNGEIGYAFGIQE